MSVGELRKAVVEENVEGKKVGDWSASRTMGASLVVVLPHVFIKLHLF
jgi:hypothetical protein